MRKEVSKCVQFDIQMALTITVPWKFLILNFEFHHSIENCRHKMQFKFRLFLHLKIPQRSKRNFAIFWPMIAKP